MMRVSRTLFVSILMMAAFHGRPHQVIAGEKPQIESGFNMLYELKFGEAREQFSEWKRANPTDPLGYAAMAASYLFEEFYYQHILTSEFFMDDERLLGGIHGKPDEGRKANFQSENGKAKELARKRLDEDPQDANALFSLTISTGMQADFLSILERRQLESLSLIREADRYAKRLIALQPDDADAWLSLGAANYIIGCLPAYKRFFLWFGRIHGDKELGMEQLRITAEKGHYSSFGDEC
jgi:tetratricopeptide (TPR) repeat protein